MVKRFWCDFFWHVVGGDPWGEGAREDCWCDYDRSVYIFIIYLLHWHWNYSKISVRIGKRKMSSSFTPDRGVWAVCRVAWVSTSVISWSCGRHFPATLGVAALCCRFDGKFPSFSNLTKRPMIRRKWMAWQWRALLMKLTFKSPLAFLENWGKCSKICIFFFRNIDRVQPSFQIADLAIKLFVCGSSGQPHAA